MRCFRTYNAAAAGPVTDDLHMSDDYTAAAATAAGDDQDSGYYQLPLPVERIFWVDNRDTFHSSVNHIAQVNSTDTHHNTTNLATGVSRLPVLDCGTTFHPGFGGQDSPLILSDDL